MNAHPQFDGGNNMISEQIRYINFMFSDLFGSLRGMIVPCRPAETIDELKQDPILKEGTSVDGGSVRGLATVESSDLRLQPDPETLIELPYMQQRIAGVMCYVTRKAVESEKGTLDARSMFHSVCKKLLENKQMRVKLEPEFHFVTEEGEPFDPARYAYTYPDNTGADILLDIASRIQDIGMGVRVAHHEAGEGQVEIEIAFDDVKKMADNLLLFKNIAIAVAREAGINATFMPKPFAGAPGNGLHCHIQIWQGDKNLFGDENTGGLSEMAHMFIAGILEHAAAITAIANPTINSYKRLVPHQEAPVYICWGPMNRTVLVRVPLFSGAQKAAIEFRSPDCMTNPYLLFASIIAAGMDGVAKKSRPCEQRTDDVFAMTDEQRERLGIKMLPATLGEALDALEHDEVIKSALGHQIVERYITLKREEWREYCNRVVTDWEWEQYSSD